MVSNWYDIILYLGISDRVSRDAVPSTQLNPH